jgi:hypothetical protein
MADIPTKFDTNYINFRNIDNEMMNLSLVDRSKISWSKILDGKFSYILIS